MKEIKNWIAFMFGAGWNDQASRIAGGRFVLIISWAIIIFMVWCIKLLICNEL